jgi:hypothetical protein
VNVLIHILDCVLLATGSDVAFTIEPNAVVCVQCPYSNIEFSALVEERVDVLLNDIGFILGKGN